MRGGRGEQEGGHSGRSSVDVMVVVARVDGVDGPWVTFARPCGVCVNGPRELALYVDTDVTHSTSMIRVAAKDTFRMQKPPGVAQAQGAYRGTVLETVVKWSGFSGLLRGSLCRDSTPGPRRTRIVIRIARSHAARPTGRANRDRDERQSGAPAGQPLSPRCPSLREAVSRAHYETRRSFRVRCRYWKVPQPVRQSK